MIVSVLVFLTGGKCFAENAATVDVICPTARGEFKAELSTLSQFYHAPRNAAENNHLFDMWKGEKLADYVRHAGLTNNHALIINSHSRSVPSKKRNRQALYPHDTRWTKGLASPLYSVRDFAKFLGSSRSADIHNIVIGGCNLDGELNACEWRRYFKNATNIVHVRPGNPGYQPMFWQVFFLPSDRIAPVYERAQRTDDDSIDYYLENRPSTDSVRMAPYVADLFKPGVNKPYRTQLAGRELLHPQSSAGNFLANRPISDLP